MLQYVDDIPLATETKEKCLELTIRAHNATKSLEMAEHEKMEQQGKTVNIWTNLKYAFSIAHAHGTIWSLPSIWKDRGLLTVQESPNKYKQ